MLLFKSGFKKEDTVRPMAVELGTMDMEVANVCPNSQIFKNNRSF